MSYNYYDDENENNEELTTETTSNSSSGSGEGCLSFLGELILGIVVLILIAPPLCIALVAFFVARKYIDDFVYPKYGYSQKLKKIQWITYGSIVAFGVIGELIYLAYQGVFN